MTIKPLIHWIVLLKNVNGYGHTLMHQLYLHSKKELQQL